MHPTKALMVRWMFAVMVIAALFLIHSSFFGGVQAQEPVTTTSPLFQRQRSTDVGIVQNEFRQSGAIAPTAGDVELLLDDGSAEESLGLSAGGQLLWFNRFTPAPGNYPFTLKTIQLYTSPESICLPTDLVDFYLYRDTNSDPADGAILVGSVLGQGIGAAGQFNSFPTHIEFSGPGDIFIAVVNRTCVNSIATYAALDTTTTQQRSWVGIYDGNMVPNPPVLPAPQFGTIDSFGFPGNWTIRGIGQLGINLPTPTITPTFTPTPTRTPTSTPTHTPTPTATSVVPEIQVEAMVYQEHNSPQITTETLTIHNVGSLTLTWAITESNGTIVEPIEANTISISPSGGDCSTPTDIPWLTVSPISGNTGSGSGTPIILTFDSTELSQANFYAGTLCIESNDADDPLTEVSLQLYYGPPTAVEISAFSPPKGARKAELLIEWLAGGSLLLVGWLLLRRR